MPGEPRCHQKGDLPQGLHTDTPERPQGHTKVGQDIKSALYVGGAKAFVLTCVSLGCSPFGVLSFQETMLMRYTGLQESPDLTVTCGQPGSRCRRFSLDTVRRSVAALRWVPRWTSFTLLLFITKAFCHLTSSQEKG